MLEESTTPEPDSMAALGLGTRQHYAVPRRLARHGVTDIQTLHRPCNSFSFSAPCLYKNSPGWVKRSGLQQIVGAVDEVQHRLRWASGIALLGRN